MTEHQASFDQATKEAVVRIYTAIRNEATQLEASHGVSFDSAQQILITRLRDYDNGLFVDGRAAMWRARLRLYRVLDPREPVADSDAGYDPREPGQAVHASLPAVCSWVAELASGYHGTPCVGLDQSTMGRRIRSFRTQMSNRKDGTGMLTLNYTAGSEPMIARCDIIREAPTAAQLAGLLLETKS